MLIHHITVQMHFNISIPALLHVLSWCFTLLTNRVKQLDHAQSLSYDFLLSKRDNSRKQWLYIINVSSAVVLLQHSQHFEHGDLNTQHYPCTFFSC